MQRNSSADNLSSEILRLVSEDPAAQIVVDQLSPFGDVYVVGGAPRDIVLGKNPKDIDMMARVDGNTIKDVLGAIKGGHVIVTGKQFPVYRFKYKGSEIEIALPRTEEKTGEGNKDWKVVFGPDISVEEDLRRRDFTVNAIAVNALTGEVHDPFGGIEDLEKTQLRTVTDTSFRDDSSRTLRALTQMAKNGIIPDDATREQMAQYAKDLNKAAPELIQKELDKIMASGNPHAAIRLAYETGVLREFLPEVEAAFGFDQKNKHHDLELGDHLLKVLENTLHSDDPDLRLAALLHDIGKPGSMWVDDEGAGHYYKKKLDDGTFVGENHEELGADLARQRMRDLRYPNERIDKVDFYVRNHMFPAFATAKGARKFLQNAGSYENAKALLALREADFSSKGRPITPEESAGIVRMHQLIDEAAANQVAVSLKDLAVNGRDLINAGIPAGPDLGRKLKVLLEEVIADPSLNTPETLIEMAKTAAPLDRVRYDEGRLIDEPTNQIIRNINYRDYLYNRSYGWDNDSPDPDSNLFIEVDDEYMPLMIHEFDMWKAKGDPTKQPRGGRHKVSFYYSGYVRKVPKSMYGAAAIREEMEAIEKGDPSVIKVPVARTYMDGQVMVQEELTGTADAAESVREEVGGDWYGTGWYDGAQAGYDAGGQLRAYDGFIYGHLRVPFGPPMARRAAIEDNDPKLAVAIGSILENGGGTFNPDNLEPVDLPGYYASVEGQEKQLPDSALTPRSLSQYLDNKAWALKSPGHYLGVWLNKGIAYLDVTRHFIDREECIEFARDNHQLAIYDSINDQVINL